MRPSSLRGHRRRDGFRTWFPRPTLTPGTRSVYLAPPDFRRFFGEAWRSGTLCAMANAANEFDDMYFRQRPRRSRAGVIGWLLFLLVAAGGAAFVKYRYLPERAEEARLRAQLGEASGREKQLKVKLAAASTRSAELEA